MKKVHVFSLSGAMNTPFDWLAFLFVAINALFLVKYSMRLSSLWQRVRPKEMTGWNDYQTDGCFLLAL